MPSMRAVQEEHRRCIGFIREEKTIEMVRDRELWTLWQRKRTPGVDMSWRTFERLLKYEEAGGDPAEYTIGTLQWWGIWAFGDEDPPAVLYHHCPCHHHVTC